MIPSLTIDLSLPPQKRWKLNKLQRRQTLELLEIYSADCGVDVQDRQAVANAAQHVIPPDYWLEMESLAGLLNLPISEVAFANVYYDSVKVTLARVFGCSAFAVENATEILHARNLDWWTVNGALNRSTVMVRFVGGPQGEFTVIGWPGFAGAFSGIAPGRFALTLNAVLSQEPPQLAMPVEFLLRQALEQEPTFDEALRRLRETPIPCDCLLLLTGAKPGELVVIERTPTRSAVRRARDGFVCTTNDYQLLDAQLSLASSPLQASCCGRYQRTESLLAAHRPQTAEECFHYLNDQDVRMSITVQQMVFSVATGRHWVRLPN